MVPSLVTSPSTSPSARTRSKPYRSVPCSSASTQYSSVPRRSWVNTFAATMSRKVPAHTRQPQEPDWRHAGRAAMLADVLIREATADDWPAIWPFLHEIVAAGETYPYDRDLTEEQSREIWMIPPPGRVVVAVDDDGTVLGTAKMHANRGGGGAHVATASFMVDPRRSRRGV